MSLPMSRLEDSRDQSSSPSHEPSPASIAMSQPAIEFTPWHLLNILRFSTVVGEKTRTSFISRRLARYSKFASSDTLHAMVDMGRANKFPASDIVVLIRALFDSQSGVAREAKIKEEGFPKFEKLPAELRTEIWKNALPGPRTIHIDPGSNEMATANIISPSSHSELFAIRSVCKESFDLVRNRYQAIPFSNFALATSTTVKPHLAPAKAANQCILVDLNHDVVHLESNAVYNCVAAWHDRERTRRVFSLTRHAPEAGFKVKALSLSADTEISLMISEEYGIKWLTQFSGLRKIVLVEVQQDIVFEHIRMMKYGSFIKQLYLKIIWEGAECGVVDF
ncbi:hypothetical protein VTL71DRAFT_5834 [Oculimacula yallundae]|uniref:2EXR domain-containing protein n=1 Tax=Oculimacula yallundae TaxID=86028 RepID=A0ABR4BZM7_9HELO